MFYNLHALGHGWLLALVLPLGTWALVVNGTFFAALSIRSRNRELAAAPDPLSDLHSSPAGDGAGITAILTGESDPGLWIQLLAGYDIIFTTICLLLFELSCMQSELWLIPKVI